MITVMRKHHKVLMIVITAVICISFSWYWNGNRTNVGALGSGIAGKIYDRNVSTTELQRNARMLRLASALGLRELAQGLTIGAQTENEAFDNFAWNLIILRHEADALGLRATKEEIVALEKTLPAFQGENGFDVAKYSDFIEHELGPLGATDAQVDELAADQIAFDRLQKLLAAGVSVPEAEMRESFEELYSKNEVSVVHFRAADFSSQAKVSDGDIAKYFEAHKAQLKTDEKRQVKVVTFALSDAEKKLTGKERIEALQKVADRANDFSDALQAKNASLDAVAAKFQVTPKETGEFSQTAPDPLLAGDPQLAQAAFSLTNDAPNSAALQGTDGFFVLHLMRVVPARPLTLAEARPKIVETLERERTESLLSAKASEVAEKLRSALKAGKTPEQAATMAGVKLEKIPAFALLDNPPGAKPAASPAPTPNSADMPYIRETVGSMNPGSVSDLVRQPDGGLLVILEKRAPLNVAAFDAARSTIEQRTLRGKSQAVFYEWLQERRRAAGVPITQREIAPS